MTTATIAALGLEHVRRLFAYHRWASMQSFDAAGSLSAAQLDQRWGGSFGNGRKLFEHIVGAERLWLDRWKGGSPRVLPAYPADWSGSAFRDERRRIADGEQQFIDGLDAKRLAGELTYVNIKGETWTYPLAEILVHVVNHGTYHRGQIAHLLRDMGLPAPTTDYIRWLQFK